MIESALGLHQVLHLHATHRSQCASLSVHTDVKESPAGIQYAPMGSHCDLACSLAPALTLRASREILLWMTPSEAPKALQASECSELLDPTGASCWIFAQR